MLQTIYPQVINARTGLSAHVFIKIGQETKPVDSGLVIFDLHLKILQLSQRQEVEMIIPSPGADPVENHFIMVYPKLVDYEVVQAVYKRSTFEGVLGNPTEAEQYALAIQQFDYIETKWEKTDANQEGGWTGEEIQQPRYWHLKAEHLKILTPEEIIQLETPYRL